MCRMEEHLTGLWHYAIGKIVRTNYQFIRHSEGNYEFTGSRKTISSIGGKHENFDGFNLA